MDFEWQDMAETVCFSVFCSRSRGANRGGLSRPNNSQAGQHMFGLDVEAIVFSKFVAGVTYGWTRGALRKSMTACWMFSGEILILQYMPRLTNDCS